MGHVLDGILRLPPLLALALAFLLPALKASAFVGIVLPGEIGVSTCSRCPPRPQRAGVAFSLAASSGRTIQ